LALRGGHGGARRKSMVRVTSAAPSSRDRWTAGERAALRRLRTPIKIQEWLDDLPYRPEESTACPRRVLAERLANCWDGALFAAAALRELGHPPVLLDLWAVRDDDHVLALFRVDGHWGAVGKSNFVGLRFREPIHRTVRELALSYFEDYFNADGEKTLRACSRPFGLARFDRVGWTFRDDHIQRISDLLDASPHAPLLTKAMERRLCRVDPRSLAAGMVGTDAAGLYRAPPRAARFTGG
jgi:hypothetical protein